MTKVTIIECSKNHWKGSCELEEYDSAASKEDKYVGTLYLVTKHAMYVEH